MRIVLRIIYYSIVILYHVRDNLKHNIYYYKYFTVQIFDKKTHTGITCLKYRTNRMTFGIVRLCWCKKTGRLLYGILIRAVFKSRPKCVIY